jgi:hypothetical protein
VGLPETELFVEKPRRLVNSRVRLRSRAGEFDAKARPALRGAGWKAARAR